MSRRYCHCRNTLCTCQDQCCCCADRCHCLQCSQLRSMDECERCSAGITRGYLPVYSWSLTSNYPNLDFLSSNPLQSSISGSDQRNDDTDSVRESRMDESLIFQMDDINNSPDVSLNKPDEQRNKDLPESSPSCPYETLSNRRQLSNISIMRDRSRCSQSNADDLKSVESQSKVPLLHSSDENVSNQEEYLTHTRIVKDLPRCSQLISNAAISKLEESNQLGTHVSENLTSSELIPNEAISKPQESEIIHSFSEIETISSASNVYSSDSLPSDLSSSNSPPCDSITLRSPTGPLSTSAPSEFEVPQRFRELESLKKTSVSQSTSEDPQTPSLPNLETLSITHFHPIDESRKESLSSSSIETLSTDINTENIKNGHPGLPTISITPSSLNNTSTQDDSRSPLKNSRLSSATLKLPSPEFSNYDRRRTSSDSSSSIETLSRDPANENNSDDETPTNMSPKNDN